VVGDDGRLIAEFWRDTMADPTCRMADRLEASRLLAERGWGKAAALVVVEEEDPLGLSEADIDLLVTEFKTEVARLAALPDERPIGATVERHGR